MKKIAKLIAALTLTIATCLSAFCACGEAPEKDKPTPPNPGVRFPYNSLCVPCVSEVGTFQFYEMNCEETDGKLLITLPYTAPGYPMTEYMKVEKAEITTKGSYLLDLTEIEVEDYEVTEKQLSFKLDVRIEDLNSTWCLGIKLNLFPVPFIAYMQGTELLHEYSLKDKTKSYGVLFSDVKCREEEGTLFADLYLTDKKHRTLSYQINGLEYKIDTGTVVSFTTAEIQADINRYIRADDEKITLCLGDSALYQNHEIQIIMNIYTIRYPFCIYLNNVDGEYISDETNNSAKTQNPYKLK